MSEVVDSVREKLAPLSSSVTLASLRRMSTGCTWEMCSSGVLGNTSMTLQTPSANCQSTV